MKKISDKKLLDTIVEHASPHITLSYIVDEKGDLLACFNLHPQMEEDVFITLDKVSGQREIMLTTDDVREFGKKLISFADTTQAIVERYNELNP